MRREQARPGCSSPGGAGESGTVSSSFPAEEEAVDVAGEDVGPNAHGSDRRRSVQRDWLCCSESRLQSHHS